MNYKTLFSSIIIIVVLLLTATSETLLAAEYADTLRVGIYYGEGEVGELTLGSDSGFSVGLVSGRSYTPVFSSSSTSLIARPDKTNGNPSYHVSYMTSGNPEELDLKITELKAAGIDAFLAYINSSFAVLGGTFKNNNDALWAAENLSIKGTPISVSSNAVIVVDNASAKPLFAVDDSVYAMGIYHINYENNDSVLNISGSVKGTYRGGFECKVLSSSAQTIAVTNIVPVESYLYSVVCREMSPSWEVEALKAQAVCARNFALGRINYHSKYGFDVCRTVCCQMYSSSADFSQNVHAAVDETKGELLFYENILVQAVYSSSMGARTESVENVWGTSYPYLVSVENPYEDTENIYNGKWTKSLTVQRATEIMNARGYSIGEVTDITVLENTPAGGVLKLLVTGTNGSKTFERESCRTIFSEATYSQRYTVSRGGQETKPTVYVSDGKSVKSVSLDTFSVLSSKDATEVSKDSFTAYDGKTKKTYSTVKAQGDANTFVFSGEGWGHGVGMSQYGAKGMASAGFSYDEILTHYYTGTHLVKAY